MNEQKKKQEQSWAEKNGAMIYGLGVWIFIALLSLLFTLFA